LDSDDSFPGLFIQPVFHEQVISAVISFVGVIILLSLSCLLASAERALFSLSADEMSDIGEEHSMRDRFIRQLLDRPQQTFFAVAMARSILHILCIALGIHGVCSISGQAANTVSYGAMIAGWMVLRYISGGLIPKFIVRNRVLRVTQQAAPYLKAIDWMLRPITKTITSPGFVVYSKKKTSANESAMISKDPIDEKEMFDEIVHFYNKRADEIMIPRLDMETVNIKCGFRELMEIIIRTGFSRIPVYKETEDNINGILYVKDLLPAIENPDTFQWQRLIRPAYFVPETKKIDDLLEEFRSNKVHIAIVVDEFGCTSGLVTMEDIIEEIVGEISDEYDNDEKLFFTLPDGSYIFEGKIQLNDFFRETDITPDEFGKMTEEVETLAGLLLKIKGTLPRRKEIIDYKNYRFRILEANERRVLKIKFSIIEAPEKKKRATIRPLIGMLLMGLSISCAEYTPKPRGFYRIEIPEAPYTFFSLTDLPYSFMVSQLATIELPPAEAPEGWINLSYETLNAKLYCSYQKISPETLPTVAGECRELLLRSVKNANAITEQNYEDADSRLYGTLFRMDGESPSPIQFMLTDSVNHFFRGALYYQCKVNTDSLTPVTRYLGEEVVELIQTFQWK
jgi:gliding motility-associated lipoprotein GldD